MSESREYFHHHLVHLHNHCSHQQLHYYRHNYHFKLLVRLWYQKVMIFHCSLQDLAHQFHGGECDQLSICPFLVSQFMLNRFENFLLILATNYRSFAFPFQWYLVVFEDEMYDNVQVFRLRSRQQRFLFESCLVIIFLTGIFSQRFFNMLGKELKRY